MSEPCESRVLYVGSGTIWKPMSCTGEKGHKGPHSAHAQDRIFHWTRTHGQWDIRVAPSPTT